MNTNFNILFKIQLSNEFYANSDKLNKIPLQWQNILLNDGSFTQNLHALTGKKIYITISQKIYQKNIKFIRNIRTVFLKNDNSYNLTFARSLCNIENLIVQKLILYNKQPFGQSFIRNKKDITKNINEIYYGYSKNLEKIFKNQNPIWGRKYNLYYSAKSYLTIQEFFSPSLIDLI